MLLNLCAEFIAFYFRGSIAIYASARISINGSLETLISMILLPSRKK